MGVTRSYDPVYRRLSYPGGDVPVDTGGAGDIAAGDLGWGLTHIGVVSDGRTAAGTPLILHDIGQGTREEDILSGYRIIGHYRYSAQR